MYKYLIYYEYILYIKYFNFIKPSTVTLLLSERTLSKGPFFIMSTFTFYFEAGTSACNR